MPFFSWGTGAVDANESGSASTEFGSRRLSAGSFDHTTFADESERLSSGPASRPSVPCNAGTGSAHETPTLSSAIAVPTPPHSNASSDGTNDGSRYQYLRKSQNVSEHLRTSQNFSELLRTSQHISGPRVAKMAAATMKFRAACPSPGATKSKGCAAVPDCSNLGHQATYIF
eukprot:SAG31_NODE_901_length_11133_cov_9.476799_1_plen_172_part_00